MIRALLAVALTCAPLPSLAQAKVCEVDNYADRRASKIEAKIGKGPELTGLLTESPLIGSKILFDDKTDFKFPADPKALLYLYRTGHSLPGKDWRQPGSVFSEVSGFGFAWPVLRKGKMKDTEYVVRFSLGDASLIAFASDLDDSPTIEFAGVTVPTLASMYDHSPHYWPKLRAPIMSERQIESWRAALEKTFQAGGGILEVQFIYFGGPKAQEMFAVTRFQLPGGAALQARLVSDVNALRKAAAEGDCPLQ